MNKISTYLEQNYAPISCRTLRPSDAPQYEDIFTQALTGKDRHYFTTDPKEVASRSLRDWADACKETNDKVIVGAFQDDYLVGVFSAFCHKDDPTGKTVYYGSEYVRPEFRNQGIAKKLITMRDAWAIGHGFDKAIYTIRLGNPWLIKQMGNGAEIVKETVKRFADGVEAPIYVLHRVLQSTNQGEQKILPFFTSNKGSNRRLIHVLAARDAGDAGLGKRVAQAAHVIGL